MILPSSTTMAPKLCPSRHQASTRRVFRLERWIPPRHPRNRCHNPAERIQTDDRPEAVKRDGCQAHIQWMQGTLYYILPELRTTQEAVDRESILKICHLSENQKNGELGPEKLHSFSTLFFAEPVDPEEGLHQIVLGGEHRYRQGDALAPSQGHGQGVDPF